MEKGRSGPRSDGYFLVDKRLVITVHPSSAVLCPTASSFPGSRARDWATPDPQPREAKPRSKAQAAGGARKCLLLPAPADPAPPCPTGRSTRPAAGLHRASRPRRAWRGCKRGSGSGAAARLASPHRVFVLVRPSPGQQQQQQRGGRRHARSAQQRPHPPRSHRPGAGPPTPPPPPPPIHIHQARTDARGPGPAAASAAVTARSVPPPPPGLRASSSDSATSSGHPGTRRKSSRRGAATAAGARRPWARRVPGPVCGRSPKPPPEPSRFRAEAA